MEITCHNRRSAAIRGTGYLDPRHAQFEGDRIFLNLGAFAIVPDMPSLSGIDYMANVELLELDTAPEHGGRLSTGAFHDQRAQYSD